jgi:UDP-glucose 4-epimerase
MKGGRVFLTGASGRIGRIVKRKLLARGYLVRSLAHRSQPDVESHPNLESINGDILDQDGLTRVLAGSSFVVHLAAAWDMFPPAVHEKENNQLFESIVRGTYNMLEASRKEKDVKAFLYASTDATYATGPRKFSAPITEETELQPSRFYALAKIVCEEMCRQYGKLYGFPWIILRICWCLDEEEILRIFQYDFWEGGMAPEDRARLGPSLADGKGVFAPMMLDGRSGVDHVSDPEDIAEGIALGLDRHAVAVNGVYNLAGPASFRYGDLIEGLAADLGVPWGSAPIKGIEPYELSIGRAARVLGYAPQFSIERMLAKAAERRRRASRTPPSRDAGWSRE